MSLPHIKAKPGDVSKNVIAVGDPARVELLASLLKEPVVVNTHRGLKIVTGYYKNTRVTIATHGMGCPSANIVFEELGMLGAKRIVRLGTAGGMHKSVQIGDVIVATGAIYAMGGCGLGQYMPGYCAPTSPDPVLTHRIMEELENNGIPYKRGPLFSSDAFYAEDPELASRMSKLGILAVEMEAAGLFALGWMRGWETACAVIISDVLHGEDAKKVFLTTSELAETFSKVARAIMEAFEKHYGDE
ncbi:MAG: purine-nucleoside phosphorylase [Thermosphaera sp.]